MGLQLLCDSQMPGVRMEAQHTVTGLMLKSSLLK